MDMVEYTFTRATIFGFEDAAGNVSACIAGRDRHGLGLRQMYGFWQGRLAVCAHLTVALCADLGGVLVCAAGCVTIS